MKLFAAFVLLIAGISALPQEVAQRSVTDQIVGAIENFKGRIRDNGLDPLHIKRESGYFALPVPVIFSAAGFCEDIMSTGLSNIVINDIDYDGGSGRLTIDLEMPHVNFYAGIAVGELTIFGHKVTGEGRGSLDFRNIRVKGVGQIGQDGRVSDIDLDTSLGGIVSDLQLNILSYDLSEYLNGLLNVVVPNYLENFKAELDELIAYYLKRYINDNILG